VLERSTSSGPSRVPARILVPSFFTCRLFHLFPFLMSCPRRLIPLPSVRVLSRSCQTMRLPPRFDVQNSYLPPYISLRTSPVTFMMPNWTVLSFPLKPPQVESSLETFSMCAGLCFPYHPSSSLRTQFLPRQPRAPLFPLYYLFRSSFSVSV